MISPSLAVAEDGGASLAPKSEGAGARSGAGAGAGMGARTSADEARLRAMRHEHFEFVWRSVRRLGVPEADADDATQQVFIVAAGKLRVIAEGSERAFLFGAALRVASHVRRSHRRRGEVTYAVTEPEDASPSAEELIDRRRARALLDEVLESLPLDVRAVFVLFELEEMTLSEIATILGIPPGTAASRLRRGRELFQSAVARLRLRQRGHG
jgi:RNA polymerase sigma-70 factor (ECF subfamily)